MSSSVEVLQTAAARLSLANGVALSQAMVRGLPRLAKYLALFTLALNWRSLPFAWHIRVFAPIIAIRLRWFVLRLTLLFHSKKERKKAERQWLENLSPVGASPFDALVTHKTWAALDDCDYNLHLSNSCYAKNLDTARLKAALTHFPGFLRAGGWIPLGATHFAFIREIPIFSKYEVRMTVASWDNKWIFLVVRFVTFPKPSKAAQALPSTPPAAQTPGNAPPFPTLHTPATPLDTPAPAPAPGTSAKPLDAAGAMRQLAAQAARAAEADGATLNCVCVNELVFKHGRITVPPALVLACDGFAGPPGAGAARYSRVHPPPHWAEVQRLWDGGVRAMREFYRGGWRAVPEGERWWEMALGGVVEERRVANLALVEGVRKGMEGAREIAANM